MVRKNQTKEAINVPSCGFLSYESPHRVYLLPLCVTKAFVCGHGSLVPQAFCVPPTPSFGDNGPPAHSLFCRDSKKWPDHLIFASLVKTPLLP